MKQIFILAAILFSITATAQPISNKTVNKSTMIEITTSYGTMVFKLYNETPLHRDNFIKLAQEGYYDGTLFHRVIRNFMIQGGDPDSKMAKPGQMLGNGGPSYTVPAEFVPTLFHKKGVLSAARMGDQVNPTKASSGSQFYIVQGQKFTDADLSNIERQTRNTLTPEQKQVYKTIGGTPHLDGNYTVFGEMISGFEVLDAIAAVPTDRMDRPATDVKMTVKVLNTKQ